MKNLIRITDYVKEDIFNIYKLASEIEEGKCFKSLKGKTIVLFFPSSSIRTKVTFEKGINMLRGQPILFPSDALDKKEEIKDVIGYLNNWADCIIVRHSNIELISEMTRYSKVPIINAMTSVNHPCEVLSDLYALSKLRKDYLDLNYTFVGENANIGMAWAEAAEVMGFPFKQCCPSGYEMKGVEVEHDIESAIVNTDIVLTDSISQVKEDFMPYQITKKLMDKANKGALLNPCPPFTRGEEVSAEVIDSQYFVGYDFKKALLPVQQAIILYGISETTNL